MNIRKLLLGGLFLALSLAVQAQKKELQRANELYKASRFAEAADLYEEVLKNKENVSIKAKLANCYRLNNRLEDAEALYAKVVQDEKAKSDTYYYYGEVLMSNEKYDQAKEWFLKYDRLEKEDGRGQLMAEACDQVRSIKPFFPYLRIDEFSQNTDADEFTAAYYQNGIVFSSDRNSGVKLMKEKSGWTGRDYLNLFFAEQEGDNQFKTPKLFSVKLNEINKNTGNPSFSTDESEVFFTRNDFETSRKGSYNMQLFHSEAAELFKWKTPKKLKFCSPEYNYMHPAISPDGKFLIFVSDKGQGQGGTDLWLSEKTEKGWGRPKNLGETINTAGHEAFPFLDKEGKLFFCSKGHVGYGGFDIFVSRKDAQGEWQTPINLGRPINSAQDDISIYLDGEKREGMFSSNRLGGDDDIFLFKAVDSKSEVGFFPMERPTTEVSDIEEKPAQEIKAEPQKKKVKNKNLSVERPQKEQSKKDNKSPAPDLFMTSGWNKNEIPLVEKQANSVNSQKVAAPAAFSNLTNQLKSSNLAIGNRYRIEKAVYGFQVYQLTPDILTSLDEIVDLLKEHPNLKIELGSHTDSFGETNDNLKLSQNRAIKAAAYLYLKGISSQQLVAKGYGETELLNHCKDGVECSMEEHLENQRLEIKILGF